jgi:Peptidase family M48
MKIVRVDKPYIARSFSFLWLKRIYIGSMYDHLSSAQRQAVLTHEEGHCALHHTELRLLTLILFPFLLKYVCHQTELAADRYVAQRGQGRGLIALMRRTQNPESFFYPSDKTRCKILTQIA